MINGEFNWLAFEGLGHRGWTGVDADWDNHLGPVVGDEGLMPAML